MATPSLTHEHLAELRRRAATRLTPGPRSDGTRFTATDALAVLHELASSPDTAADALALMHELQVHQVEVEMQAEELRESRIELESMLRRQAALYDHQPVGCFTVDRQLVVHELNLRGAHLLGLPRDEACGLALDGLLSADSARRLRGLLADLAPGASAGAAPLELLPKQGTACQVRADVGHDPDQPRFLLVLTPIA